MSFVILKFQKNGFRPPPKIRFMTQRSTCVSS